MDSILKQSMLDRTRLDILQVVKQVQTQRGLTIFDIENILYQVLTDVKIEKEWEYSNTIVELTNQVRQLEKEKAEQTQDIQTVEEPKKEG